MCAIRWFGRAAMSYADLNGTISQWISSAGTMAQAEAAPSGAGYRGLDTASTSAGDFLYAADCKQGRIDGLES